MNFLKSVEHCSTADKPLKLRKGSSHPANTKFYQLLEIHTDQPH